MWTRELRRGPRARYPSSPYGVNFGFEGLPDKYGRSKPQSTCWRNTCRTSTPCPPTPWTTLHSLRVPAWTLVEKTRTWSWFCSPPVSMPSRSLRPCMNWFADADSAWNLGHDCVGGLYVAMNLLPEHYHSLKAVRTDASGDRTQSRQTCALRPDILLRRWKTQHLTKHCYFWDTNTDANRSNSSRSHPRRFLPSNGWPLWRSSSMPGGPGFRFGRSFTADRCRATCSSVRSPRLGPSTCPLPERSWRSPKIGVPKSMPIRQHILPPCHARVRIHKLHDMSAP